MNKIKKLLIDGEDLGLVYVGIMSQVVKYHTLGDYEVHTHTLWYNEDKNIGILVTEKSSCFSDDVYGRDTTEQVVMDAMCGEYNPLGKLLKGEDVKDCSFETFKDVLTTENSLVSVVYSKNSYYPRDIDYCHGLFSSMKCPSCDLSMNGIKVENIVRVLINKAF